ncbi:unnamed protein product [Didymodactylos carnosus]|uniref:Guided entry of tail-anchored proteins factor 1 n=1 Tax=Didymodactylos carnosus TaxID=1234261 RepID=A0A8S2P7N9_9BILA|nr:unnamed protein product [Didymodactylos carnosus]CAF4035348.1 unnamed protein product [Didymodactylos carnosus]
MLEIGECIAEMIRPTVDNHDKSIPAILEIPSKEHPYDPSKDSILRRAKVTEIMSENNSFTSQSSSPYTATYVNWSLLIFSTFIICIRYFLPSFCMLLITVIDKNKKRLSNTTTGGDNYHSLTQELTRITQDLKQLSQVDQFALYSKKERQRNAVLERLKSLKKEQQTYEKHFQTKLRMGVRVVTVLMSAILLYNFRREPLWLFPSNIFGTIFNRLVTFPSSVDGEPWGGPLLWYRKRSYVTVTSKG